MKHLQAGLALAFAMAIGCGGSHAKATPKAATCADAATHAHDLVATDGGPMGGEDLAADVGALVSDHCTADAWSAAALDCIAGAKSHDELHGCLHQLSPDQLQKFHDDLAAKHPEIENQEEMMQKDRAMAPPPTGGAKPPDDPCGGKD